jgi:NAD-dependent dihydropyrimidine dehydrogenase PreA subunit
MPKPVINKDRCNDCGNCLEICPVGVFGKENEVVVVKKAAECLGCKACEVQCPNAAIEVID